VDLDKFTAFSAISQPSYKQTLRALITRNITMVITLLLTPFLFTHILHNTCKQLYSRDLIIFEGKMFFVIHLKCHHRFSFILKWKLFRICFIIRTSTTLYILHIHISSTTSFGRMCRPSSHRITIT
jgi:hypothetical protein